MKPHLSGIKPSIALLNSSLGIANRGGERVLLEVSNCLQPMFHVDRFSGGRVEGVASRRVPTLVRSHPAVRILEGLTPAPLKWLVRRLHLTPLDIERLSFNARVAPYLLKNRYDLIITQADFWTATVCRAVRALCGTPFIAVSGGLTASSRDSLSNRPDALVVVNPDVKARLDAEFPHIRIRFIPNGVDLERFVPGPFQPRFQLERPVFLCVGAFEPRKRLDLAIRAVARLKRGSLLLMGGGRLESELARLGNTLLGCGRFLKTAAPLARMPGYYLACDAFTLPSQNEPFGLVYLEALACNRPVVAPRDPIREYIVGNAGVLCNCEDIDAYARALEFVSQHAFADLPRRQAERFGWSKIGRRYADLVLEVIGRPNRWRDR